MAHSMNKADQFILMIGRGMEAVPLIFLTNILSTMFVATPVICMMDPRYLSELMCNLFVRIDRPVCIYSCCCFKYIYFSFPPCVSS